MLNSFNSSPYIPMCIILTLVSSINLLHVSKQLSPYMCRGSPHTSQISRFATVSFTLATSPWIDFCHTFLYNQLSLFSYISWKMATWFCKLREPLMWHVHVHVCGMYACNMCMYLYVGYMYKESLETVPSLGGVCEFSGSLSSDVCTYYDWIFCNNVLKFCTAWDGCAKCVGRRYKQRWMSASQLGWNSIFSSFITRGNVVLLDFFDHVHETLGSSPLLWRISVPRELTRWCACENSGMCQPVRKCGP